MKFIGACGAVPFEGSETTIGTTLKFEPPKAKPGQPQSEIVTNLPKIVVSFHDAPGATLSGISIDCNNVRGPSAFFTIPITNRLPAFSMSTIS